MRSLPEHAFEKLAKPRLDDVKKQIDHALVLAAGSGNTTASTAPPRSIDKVLPIEPPMPMPGKPQVIRAPLKSPARTPEAGGPAVVRGHHFPGGVLSFVRFRSKRA